MTIHKPTLLRVLKILNELDPQIAHLTVNHLLDRAMQYDQSLDAKKLLAGAGIKL